MQVNRDSFQGYTPHGVKACNQEADREVSCVAFLVWLKTSPIENPMPTSGTTSLADDDGLSSASPPLFPVGIADSNGPWVELPLDPQELTVPTLVTQLPSSGSEELPALTAQDSAGRETADSQSLWNILELEVENNRETPPMSIMFESESEVDAADYRPQSVAGEPHHSSDFGGAERPVPAGAAPGTPLFAANADLPPVEEAGDLLRGGPGHPASRTQYEAQCSKVEIENPASKVEPVQGNVESGGLVPATPGSLEPTKPQATTIERLPRTVMEQLPSAPGEDARLTLRLDPPELGEVIVELNRSHSGMTIRVFAERQALHLVRDQLAELRDQLEFQEIPVRELLVSPRQQGFEQERRQDWRQGTPEVEAVRERSPSDQAPSRESLSASSQHPRYLLDFKA